jgi:hypothetical protein
MEEEMPQFARVATFEYDEDEYEVVLEQAAP